MIKRFNDEMIEVDTIDIKTAIDRLDKVVAIDPEKLAEIKAAQIDGGIVKFPPRPKKEPDVPVDKVISSAKSVPAYHSTLFRNFHLSATPTYNFYTQGENVAPSYDVSGSLSALPRYITLRWRTAPTIQSKTVSTKGVRPYITPDIVKPITAATLEVAATALANGYISPGVISTVITDPPPPVVKLPTTIDEDAFLLANDTGGQSAADHVGVVDSPFVVKPLKLTADPVVVKFVDPSIAGVFDTNRLAVATDPLQLTTAGSLAKVIGALEVVSEFNQDVAIQNPPPDFTSHPDAPTLQYIGYIIERYDMLANGSMVLGRTIMISDPTMDEFIDRQVAYNGTYAYRMKSIVQWSRSADLDFRGASTIDRLSAFAGLTSPPLASFYGGEWSGWSRTQVTDDVPPEPPDEVIVRPVSWKGEIRVCWKDPPNPQDDLSKVTLLRAVVNSGKVSDWKKVADFPVGNGSYVDRDVRTFESGYSYIYALYSTSYHGQISLLSDQMEAKLSPSDVREELPVTQWDIAGADATVHASNTFSVDPTEIKANDRLTFYCRGATSRQPLRDSTYLVEVRSLSTGERALVNLDVDATDIGVVDA